MELTGLLRQWGFLRQFSWQLPVSERGGTVTLVGNLSPQIEFPLQSVVTRQITIQGSCANSGEYSAVLDLMAGGKICVDDMVSAEAPLAEGADWFHRLYNKEKGLIKVILKPG